MTSARPTKATLLEENAALRARVAALETAFAEALEQQTATAEILRVISSSPTDVQPVFTTILGNANRLCDASFSVLWLWDGDALTAVAHENVSPALAEVLRTARPRPHRRNPLGLSLLEQTVVHVPDVVSDPRFAPEDVPTYRLEGARAIISVPMVRDGRLVGVINAWRREPRPFADTQIALLQTFADQAVILIENVRLFKELEARNRDLTTALAHQTATAEVLRVISRSSTDVRPVFQAIVESAQRLLRGNSAVMSRIVDDRIELAAYTRTDVAGDALLESFFPMPRRSGAPEARPIRERVIGGGIPYNVADVETDPRVGERGRANARARGYRSQLVMPMLREGEVVGTIAVTRPDPGAFSGDEIALLETFADQAVIAIENVRLFKELQEKNRALTTAHAQVTEALEQQTATSEILRAISQSQTDVQPVFNTIVQSGLRLLGGFSATMMLLRTDDSLDLVAYTRTSTDADTSLVHSFPLPLRSLPPGERAVRERRACAVEDVETATDVSEVMRETGRTRGWRSNLFVPMIRDDVAVGLISVTRRDPGPFAADEVALLETFADQAVIAIENVRLFTELEARNRDLTAALDQQTATAEILRVISSSPTVVQPVFETIVDSAMRLFGAWSAGVYRFDGDVVDVVAMRGGLPDSADDLRQRYPMRPTATTASAHLPVRAIVEGAVEHTADIDQHPDAEARAVGRARGYRAAVAVPMLRGGRAIGAIGVSRVDPGAYSATEIDLLKTFAEQAVIAIENVRLFTELGAKNRALTEALDQQTATAEILRVISSSPTDVQPVFNMIARRAVELCRGRTGAVLLVDERRIVWKADYNMSAEAADIIRRHYPAPIDPNTMTGRAIFERRVVNIRDVLEEPDYGAAVREMAPAIGHRAVVAVPMLRDGEPIGAIAVGRSEPEAFSERDIDLLKTFADQAVIAIENVRLFTELEAKNRALTEALDQQTATAEILRVISSSPTDIQPVFTSLVASAARLCGANDVLLLVKEGDVLRPAAGIGSFWDSLDGDFRVALVRGSVAARSVIDATTLHIADLHSVSDTEFQLGKELQRRFGHRTVLAVPLLREHVALGTIFAMRFEVLPFTDAQIALVQTFADQAVIAIENVRLFKELEARTAALTRSVDQLTALGEVGRAVSSTLDLETVLTTIVSRAVDLTGLDGGVVLEYDEEQAQFVQRAQTGTGGPLAAARRGTLIRAGEGVVGRTAITREPVQVFDITAPGAYVGPNRENLIESGVRAILAVPMIREGQLIGCLGVTRNQPMEFPTETIDLLRTFATQSALAIQNARLFQELAEKSRELEIASQHKSEFLASMSHELRTPLNAIIGFSDVLLERMFGDVNDKQEEYLRDILASGRHLLSLINDILDLSKIEAGRMDLELSDFDLPTAIENALTLMRERAARREIGLTHSVDDRLGEVRADERKVKQVLLNLLSNAVKFTPEGGRVEVRAAPGEAGMVEIAVTDTGVGIAPEDHEAVFEEFRQVGRSDKRAEGTGLGLALCRKFVELHGGRIWLKSQPGHGSTFAFTIPSSPSPARA